MCSNDVTSLLQAPGVGAKHAGETGHGGLRWRRAVVPDGPRKRQVLALSLWA